MSYSTGCQPLSIAPRGELPGPQIWATVYSSGWQPVLKLISSLPGMRLNCAPRRFFHMKENGVFLCIKEMRGFSILLRSRTNHFKTSCFPVFCLRRKRLTKLRCLLLSSIALLGELPGPHIWATVQFRQQTPMTDMGSLCHANARSVSLLWVPTPYSAPDTTLNLVTLLL